jgi:hypothetical protein
MNIDPGLLDNDLGSAIGTEMLLAHDLVSDGLPASREPAKQQMHPISEGQDTRQSIKPRIVRHSSQVSKIWQYGMELRALDTRFESVVEQWFHQEALD